MTYETIIAIDVGIQGGMAILQSDSITAQKIPVKKVVVNKKKKNVYDIEKIVEILSKYKDKKVLFIQEAVSCMPHEGAVSSFSFGRSAGLTIGMASAFNFEIIEIHPTKWKKYFSQLTTQSIIDLKAQVKKLKEEGKIIKDKAQKKLNKKEVDKLNRSIKAEMKASSINLVKEIYPSLDSILAYKNTDGIAESILLAIYGKENF